MSTNHNLFEEKGEPKRYRTEVLPLTSLTPYRQAKPAHTDAIPASAELFKLFNSASFASVRYNNYRLLGLRAVCNTNTNTPPGEIKHILHFPVMMMSTFESSILVGFSHGVSRTQKLKKMRSPTRISARNSG